MRLKDLLTEDVASISPEKTLVDAAKLMERRGISSLLIIKNEQVIGIISESDFVKAVSSGKNKFNLPLGELMSQPLITQDINKTLEETLELMHQEGIRKIPITREGLLVGIITETDITNALRPTKRTNPKVDEKISTKEKNLQKGETYLFFETKLGESLQKFIKIAEQDTPSLILTRQNPHGLRKIKALKDTRIIWLTDNRDKLGEGINPHNINDIVLTLRDFMKFQKEPIVMLHGLSYLITQNSFDIILRLIQNVRDKTISSNSILLLILDPKTITNQQLELLKQDVDTIF